MIRLQNRRPKYNFQWILRDSLCLYIQNRDVFDLCTLTDKRGINLRKRYVMCARCITPSDAWGEKIWLCLFTLCDCRLTPCGGGIGIFKSTLRVVISEGLFAYVIRMLHLLEEGFFFIFDTTWQRLPWLHEPIIALGLYRKIVS